MNYKIVAERMLALKEERKISVSELEQKTKLSSKIISNILFGKRPPKLEEFVALCAALQADADELLRADGEWE